MGRIRTPLSQSDDQELCQCVASWLSYKSLTGLRGHLNESSITTPIAEYLTTKYSSEVQSEKTHPLFKSRSKGRPKQIDFVRAKNRGKDWHAVYECKFQTDTAARLIGDICRLACFSQSRERGNPQRKFILAGRRDSESVPIDRMINRNDGKGRISIFEGILARGEDAREQKKTVQLSKLHTSQIALFAEFARLNNVALPSVLVTELSGLFVAGLYACSIWNITASKGAKLLEYERIREFLQT